MAVSVTDKGFNRSYRCALRNAGFAQVGANAEVFGLIYISNSASESERVASSIGTFFKKINSLQRRQRMLCFTITDKQFSLIGNSRLSNLKGNWRFIPSQIGRIPATQEQYLYSGNWNRDNVYYRP
jgi:hypothetical protein